MKFHKVIFSMFFLSFMLFSCSNDDEYETIGGIFENGIFILNEGSQGQGTVSYLSNDFQQFTKDVYTNANPRDLMGKFAQSIFFDGDNAYIIAGGSQKINVVNKNTFKLIAKIETGLNNPRYGVVKDGKAYVTNANTYSNTNPITANTDDFVAIIDLASNAIEATIPVNGTADKLVLYNDKLYIIDPINSNKILVVNTNNRNLETSINIDCKANSLEIYNNYLYLMANTNSGNSKLIKVNLLDNQFSIIDFTTDLQGAKNLDIYKNDIYFTVNTKVYKMGIGTIIPPSSSVLDYTSNSDFGVMYGFAVNNNHIFIADGGDFTEDSMALIYSLSGNLEKTLTVGVGPNGFYFN